MGDYPDLEEVVDRLIEYTWETDSVDSEYHQQILNVVQRVTVNMMMIQAVNEDSSGESKAVLADRLNSLAEELEDKRNASAHEKTVAADIRRWQQDPIAATPDLPLRMPAGDPI
jgi:hypothetical protein